MGAAAQPSVSAAAISSAATATPGATISHGPVATGTIISDLGKIACRSVTSIHNKSDSKSDKEETPVVKEMRENPAYMDLYAQLIGIKALERFYQFDTNKDGFITPGEVLARNITIEGFNLVDLDMDGLIVPAEIDESLVI